MKEAASHQMEVVADVTKSLGDGLKKSLRTCNKKTCRFTKSVSEFVDVEDILKSIHKLTNPKEYDKRQSNIIHTPIDWSKHPPSSRQKFSK